jgi:hypothetical protein
VTQWTQPCALPLPLLLQAGAKTNPGGFSESMDRSWIAMVTTPSTTAIVVMPIKMAQRR